MGIRGKNAGWKNTNTITTLQLYSSYIDQSQLYYCEQKFAMITLLCSKLIT